MGGSTQHSSVLAASQHAVPCVCAGAWRGRQVHTWLALHTWPVRTCSVEGPADAARCSAAACGTSSSPITAVAVEAAAAPEGLAAAPSAGGRPAGSDAFGDASMPWAVSRARRRCSSDSSQASFSFCRSLQDTQAGCKCSGFNIGAANLVPARPASPSAAACKPKGGTAGWGARVGRTCFTERCGMPHRTAVSRPPNPPSREPSTHPSVPAHLKRCCARLFFSLLAVSLSSLLCRPAAGAAGLRACECAACQRPPACPPALPSSSAESSVLCALGPLGPLPPTCKWCCISCGGSIASCCCWCCRAASRRSVPLALAGGSTMGGSVAAAWGCCRCCLLS